MYFDAVLNERNFPLFNGTPKETREWLLTNETNSTMCVCIGRTLQMVSIEDYLA